MWLLFRNCFAKKSQPNLPAANLETAKNAAALIPKPRENIELSFGSCGNICSSDSEAVEKDIAFIRKLWKKSTFSTEVFHRIKPKNVKYRVLIRTICSYHSEIDFKYRVLIRKLVPNMEFWFGKKTQYRVLIRKLFSLNYCRITDYEFFFRLILFILLFNLIHVYRWKLISPKASCKKSFATIRPSTNTLPYWKKNFCL